MVYAESEVLTSRPKRRKVQNRPMCGRGYEFVGVWWGFCGEGVV